MNRRDFVKVVTGVCGSAVITGIAPSAYAQTAAKSEENKDIKWFKVSAEDVEGMGWKDTESEFDRLPGRAKNVVRKPVWYLSHQTAGMSVRFMSNSDKIWCRWKLLSERLAMIHMPATGVSGVDLYAQDKKKRWRWLAIGKPKQADMEQKLISGLDPGKRAYMLYFPLYNGVKEIEIGVDVKADFSFIAPRKEKPIVFYGTSIMQGGCASRPGMCLTGILGRRLGQPTINLGFSGNGKMEPEVAELLAELDAKVYVIDCLPNMNGEMVAERAEPLVRILRKAHKATPIVLVEDRTYSNAYLIASKREHHRLNRAALRKAYENLTASGVKNLHYVRGEHLLGDDNEATVDSSHPTDLGFMRQADVMEKVLRPLI